MHPSELSASELAADVEADVLLAGREQQQRAAPPAPRGRRPPSLLRRGAHFACALVLAASAAVLALVAVVATGALEPRAPPVLLDMEKKFSVPAGGGGGAVRVEQADLGRGMEGCADMKHDQECVADASSLGFEGDVVLDADQRLLQESISSGGQAARLLRSAKRVAKRAMKRLLQDETYDPHDGNIQLWPNGVVKYSWGDMPDACREVMKTAMAVWESRTCLTFQESSPGKGVVEYKSSERGCHASLGYSSHWEHIVNLESPNCCFVGVALHELGHAIALKHEHNRPEAREYIHFNYDNIQEWWKQWMKFADDWGDVSAGTPYDMSSIMHYHRNMGAIDPKADTISVDKMDVFGNCQVGQHEWLTPGDILTVNRWYGCPNKFCADLHAGCQGWKDLGYCTRKYVEWMKSNCAHTCGQCECVDILPDKCRAWAEAGRCVDDRRLQACKTTEGADCVLPFIYEGTTYHSCTDADQDFQWCSTQTDSNGVHISGQFGQCGEGCQPANQACATTEGDKCVFPFTWQGATYHGCTDTNHHTEWCQTETGWGNCGEGCQEAAMSTHCRKSCGFCGVEDVGACLDDTSGYEWVDCTKGNVSTTDGWMNCSNSMWFRGLCKKTCGMCPHEPYCW